MVFYVGPKRNSLNKIKQLVALKKPSPLIGHTEFFNELYLFSNTYFCLFKWIFILYIWLYDSQPLPPTQNFLLTLYFGYCIILLRYLYESNPTLLTQTSELFQSFWQDSWRIWSGNWPNVGRFDQITEKTLGRFDQITN